MDDMRFKLFPPNIDVSARRDASKETSAAGNHTKTNDRQERELDRIAGASEPKTMSVPLSVLVPLLIKAAENNHTWLDDFSEDVVQIDNDLHEVLMAFQNLPSRRAA